MLDLMLSFATIASRGEWRKWVGAQSEQFRQDCLRRSRDVGFPRRPGPGRTPAGTADLEVSVPESSKMPGIAKAKSHRACEVSEIFEENYADYQ